MLRLSRRRSRLPVELYSNVLRNLPTDILLKTALVSRDFQIESEVYIYRTILISTQWMGIFESFRHAVLSEPRRQTLVKEIFTLFTGWGPSMRHWVDSLDFSLSTFPNVKLLTLPWIDDISDLMLDTNCRFEVLHTEIFKFKNDLLSFYLHQPSLRELSMNGLLMRDHPNVAAVLPNLVSIAGPIEMIQIYAPGHPIAKVHVRWVVNKNDLMKDILPPLRQSTVAITHLQLMMACATPDDIGVVVDGLPTLRTLLITDEGDLRQSLDTDVHWLPASYSTAFEYVGRNSSEFPHLTPIFVDTLFAPLARLSALEHFKFQYAETESSDTFTVYDLSHSLGWREEATPQLRSLEINHMKLVKKDGVWAQTATVDWIKTAFGTPFTFPWKD